MAGSNCKILCLTALLLTGAGGFELRGAHDTGAGDISGDGMKMPVYEKEKLEFIISSSQVEKSGNLITATEPVIELIRPDADIDAITFMEEMMAYPLREKEKIVVDFWNGRRFSSALLSSIDGQIDQESRIAAGEGPVFLRSPLADLNGVGYVADYQKHTVLIRSQVEMVGRMALKTVEDIAAAAEAVRENPDESLLDTMLVWSDQLFIDLKNNQATLTGNVKLHETRIEELRCDSMVIHFESRETAAPHREAPAMPDEVIVPGDTFSPDAEAFEESAEDAADSAPSEAVETPADSAPAEAVETPAEDAPRAQKAFDSSDPLNSGSRRLADIVCEGNVYLKDSKGDLYCGRLTLLFRENDGGENVIDRIICERSVRIIGKKSSDSDENAPAGNSKAEDDGNPLSVLSSGVSSGTITSDYGELNFPANTGSFIGNVELVDNGGSTLNCDELYLYAKDISPEDGPVPEYRKGDEFPSRIGLTENKELLRIVAVDNVKLDTTDPRHGRQIASGSRAVYEVSSREIELVDEVNGMASLIRFNDGRKYMSRKLFINLATGDARGKQFRSVPYK